MNDVFFMNQGKPLCPKVHQAREFLGNRKNSLEYMLPTWSCVCPALRGVSLLGLHIANLLSQAPLSHCPNSQQRHPGCFSGSGYLEGQERGPVKLTPGLCSQMLLAAVVPPSQGSSNPILTPHPTPTPDTCQPHYSAHALVQAAALVCLPRSECYCFKDSLSPLGAKLP